MQSSKKKWNLELSGYLLDGLSLVEKKVLHTLIMSRGLYTSENFKQLIRDKNEGKLGTLFTIMI